MSGIKTQFVDGFTGAPVTTFEYSHPSPILSVSAVAVTKLRTSPDHAKILGDVRLVGTVDSDVADFTAGAAGTIDEVKLYINGGIDPAYTANVAFTKTPRTGRS